MIDRIKQILFSLVFISNFTASSYSQNRVVTGAERLLDEYFHLITNKKIGIVTNHSAILPNRVHLIDTLLLKNSVVISAIFGPEHGFQGNAADGKKISNDFYLNTSIPVYSLYGEKYKPSPDMLKNIDVMIFDIQDIGARFYTYISTLYYVIESCNENNLPLIVLDRPNPISGNYVDGPVLDSTLKSFIGIIPIPITHGMTVGELALLMNEKYFANKVNLKVIPMLNWKRDIYFDECNLPWINPSPNIVNNDAAIIYPGICLIEGTNISEGRGTYLPFLQIGAPFINSKNLLSELKKNSKNIEGISFDTISFIPKSIPGMSDKPKFIGEKCYGLRFSLTNRDKFESVKFGVILIHTLIKLYPDKIVFRNSFDRLFGKVNSVNLFKNITSIETFISSWKNELEDFMLLRKNYLIY